MRFVILLAACATAAAAGDWIKTGPAALRFEGRIEEDEFSRFSLAFSGAIKEIAVDSQGGDTTEGIKIGHAIAASNVKILVVGKCLSSCANYIFTAGHQREIMGGAVGFHGNVQGCFGGAKRAASNADLRKQGLSEDDIRRHEARQDHDIAEEARLLKIMGVSQELFDRSCTPDKGMRDGRKYEFLFPKKGTLERYGYWGVAGEQNLKVLKDARWPYAVD